MSRQTHRAEPVIGRPPTLAGAAARRIAASTPARAAAGAPEAMRRAAGSPIVHRALTSAVDSVERDVRSGIEVGRDIVRSVPRDGARVARAGLVAGYVAGRVTAPALDYVYDRAAGWVEHGLADIVSRRPDSGGLLDFSRWAELRKYRTRWDP